MNINIIELFSGIGGFSKGLADAGFKIKDHYFSEIDKHAIANYKYNFPHAKYIGSVTDISGRDFSGIDIITFGSPCQDFSLAGKRKGLEGQRSSLVGEAIKMKGEFEKGCYNRNCNNIVSDYLNHKNGKYYCLKCAVMINKFNKEFKAEHGFNLCEKVTKIEQ